MNIPQRPRRLRSTAAMRSLVRETRVDPAAFILPVFVREGLTEPQPISGMPGVFQHTLESLKGEVDRCLQAGIGGVMLFAVPETRDPDGSCATDPAGILSTAVREVRAQSGNDLIVTADLCLDEFTSHGHCGVLDSQGRVDNDRTLGIYGQMAQVLAEAGAHLLGTSGMMDGQVRAVRSALDEKNQTDVAILAYAAKYASAFYSPFRNAVESKLEGDRRTYQQDPSNAREALREVRLDVEEGADIIMVKPAIAYLDVLRAATEAIDVPTAAYIVSGENAMVEAAAIQGWLNREQTIMELLTSVRRAGASVICTYWALEAAQWIKDAR